MWKEVVVCCWSSPPTWSHSWCPVHRSSRDPCGVMCKPCSLLVGAILSPGQRTVSAALRAVGLRHVRPFQADHRVLHRALWSSRRASRLLLGLRVAPFVPPGPLVLGIEETTLAPPRQADRGGWHLARPRAREPPPCRAGAWAALGRPPAARARAVGNAGLGLALSDCARLLPSARPSGSAAGTNP